MKHWAETVEKCKAEKPTWPRGEWDDEPDYHDFVYKGRTCIVVRNYATGSFCGYVCVPENHSIFDKGRDYIVCELDVHGGVTFVEDDMIGFDTAHYGDYCPAMESMGLSLGGSKANYRNLEYTIKELKGLVDQIGAENSFRFITEEEKDA